jgi:hypothetical protein
MLGFGIPPGFWGPWDRSGANPETIGRQSAGGGPFSHFALRRHLTLPIPDSHASLLGLSARCNEIDFGAWRSDLTHAIFALQIKRYCYFLGLNVTRDFASARRPAMQKKNKLP